MADSDHQAERAPDAEGAARKMDGRQYDGEGPHRAGERAYGKTANYLRTLPLHYSQRVKDTTEAYTDFSYDIRPTPDFIGELLKYDQGLEVVDPPELRAKMRQMIAETLKRY